MRRKHSSKFCRGHQRRGKVKELQWLLGVLVMAEALRCRRLCCRRRSRTALLAPFLSQVRFPSLSAHCFLQPSESFPLELTHKTSLLPSLAPKTPLRSSLSSRNPLQKNLLLSVKLSPLSSKFLSKLKHFPPPKYLSVIPCSFTPVKSEE